MDLVALGANVRQHRIAKKISQKELGKIVGCAPSYLSLIENAARHSQSGAGVQPDADLLDRLSEQFDIHPNVYRVLAGHPQKEDAEIDADVIEIAGYMQRLDKRDRDRIKRMVREYAAPAA